MTRAAVVVVLLAACSTPVQNSQGPLPSAPPDDEERAVAWQKAHPKPDADLTAIDWEKARKFTLSVKGTPIGPCDYRRKGLAPRGVECLPGGDPVMLGALVRNKKSLVGDRTEIEIDIGVDLHITHEWYVAVLDESGHVLGTWVHPDIVFANFARVTVDVPSPKIEMWKGHAVVTKEPRR
ncbi:MAG: hypothetical protein H0T46_08955 [Deltaproteobacteria bacterium]|nr:hypothetical protein [Deltaproteobacteria bacterium]